MPYIILIAWLLTLDTITKFFAENNFISELVLVPNFLSFYYAQNTGIAFSLPLTWTLLKVITVILIFAIFWYYWTQERLKKSINLDISYCFIFAWALGNAWERIYRNYVTDFISVEYFSIFNLADSYITLWAIWVIYYYMKNK